MTVPKGPKGWGQERRTEASGAPDCRAADGNRTESCRGKVERLREYMAQGRNHVRRRKT